MTKDYLVNAFLAHLIISDGQVDRNEIDTFGELPGGGDISLEEKEKVHDIISGSSDADSLAKIINGIKAENSDELSLRALREGLKLAYSDGFLDPLEEEIFGKACVAWRISLPSYNHEKVAIAEAMSAPAQAGERESDAPGVMARMKLSALKLLNRVGVRGLEEDIEILSTRLLLSGPEYGDAIKACGEIAAVDFAIVEGHLDQTVIALRNLYKEIEQAADEVSAKGGSDTEGLKDSIEKLKFNLQNEILTLVENSQAALVRKKRAMHMFTISFLGKTKAGKSTLHAVITGEGFESIGAGKQRTTRYNRVYRWKNLRIVDTPGIEAPQEGGEQDKKVASSVIDESDVICFVVINDSQQTPELDFLGEIREQNKPVIILLNVKEDLTHPVRLKKFLENPEHWATRDDAKSLKGHIERIQRYAREKYMGGPVTVIPVQLLAATMAIKKEHPEHETILFRGSRIDRFLDSLRIALVDEGLLRRSQTLLDGTRHNLDQVLKKLAERSDILASGSNKISDKRQRLKAQMSRASDRFGSGVDQEIQRIFAEVRATVMDFSEKNYDSDDEQISRNWTTHIKKVGLEKRIEDSYKTATNGYLAELQESLEEISQDFAVIAGESSSGLKGLSDGTFSYRSMFNFVGGGLAIAGAVLLLMSNPVGWVVGIIGGVCSFFGSFFESGAEKRQKKAKKIADSLYENLEKNEKITSESIKKQWKAFNSAVQSQVDKQLNLFEDIFTRLHISQSEVVKELIDRIDTLNRVFAYRLLQFALHGNAAQLALEMTEVEQKIIACKRTPGKEFAIISPFRLNPNDLSKISTLIGEKISLTLPSKG